MNKIYTFLTVVTVVCAMCVSSAFAGTSRTGKAPAASSHQAAVNQKIVQLKKWLGDELKSRPEDHAAVVLEYTKRRDSLRKQFVSKRVAEIQRLDRIRVGSVAHASARRASTGKGRRTVSSTTTTKSPEGWQVVSRTYKVLDENHAGHKPVQSNITNGMSLKVTATGPKWHDSKRGNHWIKAEAIIYCQPTKVRAFAQASAEIDVLFNKAEK